MKHITSKYNNIFIKLKRLFVTILVIIAAYSLYFLILEKNAYKCSDFNLYRDYLRNFFIGKSILFLITIPTIITPIFEEMLFRSWLVITPRNITLFIGSMPYFIFKVLLNFPWYIELIIGVCTGFILYKISSSVLSRFSFNAITNNFYLILLVIFSSTIFGLAHVFNYPEINMCSITLVIPQIITGFGLAYIRVKNGLNWSIALHSLNNLPATILLLFQQ